MDNKYRGTWKISYYVHVGDITCWPFWVPSLKKRGLWFIFMKYLQYNHNDNLLMHSRLMNIMQVQACARERPTHIKRRCKKKKPTCRHIWMQTRKRNKNKDILFYLFIYAKFAIPSPFERITILLSKSFFTHVFYSTISCTTTHHAMQCSLQHSLQLP
jgi:hypothetical protein